MKLSLTQIQYIKSTLRRNLGQERRQKFTFHARTSWPKELPNRASYIQKQYITNTEVSRDETGCHSADDFASFFNDKVNGVEHLLLRRPSIMFHTEPRQRWKIGLLWPPRRSKNWSALLRIKRASWIQPHVAGEGHVGTFVSLHLAAVQ